MSFTLIQTQSASSQTVLDFTSGINSSFNNYMMMFHGISCPTATQNMIAYAQISTDGGMTWLTTGYRLNAQSVAGLSLGVFASSDYILSGQVLFFNLTSGSGYITSANNSPLFYPSNACFINNIATGYNTPSISANAIRIVMGNGTNFSGEFSLYSLDS